MASNLPPVVSIRLRSKNSILDTSSPASSPRRNRPATTGSQLLSRGDMVSLRLCLLIPTANHHLSPMAKPRTEQPLLLLPRATTVRHLPNSMELLLRNHTEHLCLHHTAHHLHSSTAFQLRRRRWATARPKSSNGTPVQTPRLCARR
jgi:hypothetical protein